MFLYPRLRVLLHSQTPKCHLLHSLNSFSTTSDSTQNSFTISYLTNNCGLSPQDALKASKRIHFTTPDKPDSVVSFFKNHGFFNHHIQTIILKDPELLVSNPIKSLLPKFQFLSSKGVSPTDIVATVIRSPRFLRVSLEKHIIPAFELD
ncbi:hypothetical protein KIW84_041007 [Lathyrus oleraceus]|uniref:Uncharacterized protein n=1 Tax=Pisum sativum TaxID=3888 RepID=A0A9D4X737_PEA|nr:hypothetical protein KIW84_041007 [Pisum sativum]